MDARLAGNLARELRVCMIRKKERKKERLKRKEA
jgi:hypothetical protein